MATLVAAPTVPVLEGLTRAQLIRKLSEKTGLVNYGTVTEGTEDSFTDTARLKSSQYASKRWAGAWARISSTSGHAAPEGEISPVSAYQPELGKVTVNPRWTAEPAAGDTYELWKVDPSVVLDMIDTALKDELYLSCWTVLSELPDYDMEQSTKADWTDVGTAVSAKATTEPLSMWNGKRYLSITHALATDYTRSALLYGDPGRTYHVSALVRAVSGGAAKLTAWDETNGAAITSWTSDRRFPVRLVLDVTLPAGCESWSLRLGCDEASTVTAWDEIATYAIGGQDIALPWWVKSRDQVKGIFRLQPPAVAERLWDPVLVGEVDQAWDNYDGPIGRGQMRTVSRYATNLSPWPLFILGTRNETAYADDNTDVKHIDPALFLACMRYKIYEYLSQPLNNGILDSANLKIQLERADKDYALLLQQQATALNTTIVSPTPMGQYIDQRFNYGG